MGLADREYYREEQTGWRIGGDHSMVTILIAINAAVYLLQVLFDSNGDKDNFTDALCVHADLFSHPWDAWQLLTAGFAHDPSSILHILFNMFALWLFGRDVEAIYGRAEFLRIYLVTMVLSALAWVAVQFATGDTDHQVKMLGASGAITGIMIIFVMHYPKRVVYIWGLIPVPVWLLGVFFVLSNLFGMGGVTNPNEPQVAYEAHLAGALIGFLYYQSGFNFGRFFPSKLKFPGSGKPKLRVHAPEESAETFDQRLDRILAKIADKGIDSLSAEEQRLLEDASRRMQRRRS